MWRSGCIIRSAFLERIKEAFDRKPDLAHLLLDEYFRGIVQKCQASWRRVIMEAVRLGIPVPALSASLAFYDGYRCATAAGQPDPGPARLFRAHTYERLDQPRGTFFHTQWQAHQRGEES